ALVRPPTGRRRRQFCWFDDRDERLGAHLTSIRPRRRITSERSGSGCREEKRLWGATRVPPNQGLGFFKCGRPSSAAGGAASPVGLAAEAACAPPSLYGFFK